MCGVGFGWVAHKQAVRDIMAWHGVAWHGASFYDMPWHGVVGMAWHGVAAAFLA